MKEWWNNLALREKQTVSLGALALVFLLLYLIIWVPFSNKLDSMRSKIKHDQQLLSWMKETHTRIQSTEKQQQKKNTIPSGTSLLSLIQHKINQTTLVSNLSQLRQSENDSVQLSFNNVDFDKLIEWLTQLWQQQGVTISQMTVTASTTPGLVTTEMTLKTN